MALNILERRADLILRIVHESKSAIKIRMKCNYISKAKNIPGCREIRKK